MGVPKEIGKLATQSASIGQGVPSETIVVRPVALT
jgi:hypothetical protein